MSIHADDRFPSVPDDYDTSLDVGLSAYPPYVSGSPARSDPPSPVPAAPDLASSSAAAPPISPPSLLLSPSAVPYLIGKVFAFKAVNDFFAHLATTRTRSVARLKRSIIRAMSDCASVVPPPSTLCVEDMFRLDMFASGAVPLSLSDRRLDAAAIISRHVAACPSCAFHGSLRPDCYMSSMIRCITHGWAPPVDLTTAGPQFWTPYRGNHLSASIFPGFVSSQVDTLSAAHAIDPATPLLRAVTPLLLNPLGVVIRPSDRARARLTLDTDLSSQEALDSVNAALVADGLKPIKGRLVLDNSMSRLNSHATTPPFQFSSIDDLATFIEPGWWIATGDVEAYYHRFPLALLSRCLFGFVWNFVYWFFTVVPFGFGPSPYYCSGWSAEFYRWVRHARVPATVYMDDWATTGATEAAAIAHMRTITDLLEPCGILFNTSKFTTGQRVVYLGVLFDTVAMSLSFEPSKASVLLDILRTHHATIARGSNLPHAEIRSIAGKLSWFAQVLQQGRLHTRSWWLYVVFGYRLLPATRARLLLDTAWWLGILVQWAAEVNASQQFPLLSVHTFWADPSRAWIIVSDASGTDGLGYYYGPLSSNTPAFRSAAWSPAYRFTSSHCGELTALWHFVERTDISNCLLIWVSDSQSAVVGVNKGTCRPDDGLAILSLILERCDSSGIVLLAFWIPRELNRVSDYLSHLSTLLRSDAAGTFDPDATEDLARAASGILDASIVSTLARSTGVSISDVGQVVSSSRVGGPPQRLHGQDQYSRGIPGGVRTVESPSVSPLRRLSRNVLGPVGHAERGQLSECRHIQDGSPPRVRDAGSPLAVPGRSPPAKSDYQSPRSGRFPPAPEEDAPPGAPFAACDGMDQSVGPPSAAHPTSSLRRSRRPPPSGRDHIRPDDSLSNLVARQAGDGDSVFPIEDVPDGSRVPRPISRSADGQRSFPDEGVVGYDGTPSSDDGVSLSQEALRHSF